MSTEKKNKRIAALNGRLRGREIFLVAAEGTKSRIAFDEKIKDLGFRELTAGEIEPYRKMTIKEIYEEYGIILDRDEFMGHGASTHIEIKIRSNYKLYGKPHIPDSLSGVDPDRVIEVAG